jgi:quinol monooxygenase YgiN
VGVPDPGSRSLQWKGDDVEGITVIATCPRIPGDNLIEFKKAAAQAVDIARSEAKTHRYDWFLNDDETGCRAIEEYEDSAVLLAHVGRLGALFRTLLELADESTSDVIGDASTEVRDAMTGLNASFFPSRFQGK